MKIKHIVIGAFAGMLATILIHSLVYAFWRSQPNNSSIFHVSSKAYLIFVHSGIMSIPYYEYLLVGLIIGSGVGVLVSRGLSNTSNVHQFLGGFVGWFLMASVYLLILLPMGCLGVGAEDALGCVALFVSFDGITILLTIGLTIYLFRTYTWIATGILFAVAVNLLFSILLQQFFSIFQLGIPFFRQFLQ